jgi:hypothetical protein
MRGGSREQVVQLVQQAVSRVRLPRHDPPLQVGHDFVEGMAQRRAIGGEQKHEHAEGEEYDEVKRPVDRDQAQHDLVAQPLAPQRQLDLRALRRERAARLLGRPQRKPAVAAQAAIPARAARVLTCEDRILRAQLGRVGAHELMTAQAAQQQLPMQTRTPPSRRLRAWRVMRHRATVSVIGDDRAAANAPRRGGPIGDTQRDVDLGLDR